MRREIMESIFALCYTGVSRLPILTAAAPSLRIAACFPEKSRFHREIRVTPVVPRKFYTHANFVNCRNPNFFVFSLASYAALRFHRVHSRLVRLNFPHIFHFTHFLCALDVFHFIPGVCYSAKYYTRVFVTLLHYITVWLLRGST